VKAELRNYLSFQSEIGTDEVILPKPLMARVVFQHAPGLQPTSPSNVFGDLARDFKSATKAELKGNSGGHALGTLKVLDPVKVATPSLPDAVSIPTFHGLDEYWAYLEKNSRTIFTCPEDIRVLKSSGPSKARLALIAFAPNETDMVEGRLFTGESGVLLGKMMRAIHLEVADLYCTSLIKHVSASRAWSRRELTRILPLLNIELGLCQVPVGLILGEANAQAILKTTKPMQELRQIPHREGGMEFVVTYHPEDLLRQEELKRKTWQDLQWLERRMNQALVQT
jgi:DNA polymerase